MEEFENTFTIIWQRIVDARLADVDQLPYEIARSIRADFALLTGFTTVESGSVKNFLWQHIAILTDPHSKTFERRQSLDTLRAIFTAIDRAKQTAAAAAPILVHVAEPENVGVANSNPRTISKLNDADANCHPAVTKLAGSDDGEQQSRRSQPSGTIDTTAKENVNHLVEIQNSKNFEVMPTKNDIQKGDAVPPRERSTPPSDRTYRENETKNINETEPAKSVHCSTHVDQGHHSDSDEEPQPNKNERPQSKLEQAPSSSVVLGPKYIVVGGPAYDDNNQNEGNAFCWHMVSNHAAEFARAHTSAAKRDVCWKVYSHLLGLGFHFLRRESATSTHLRMMEEDIILQLLENSLSWKARNLVVVDREQQSSRPEVEGDQQPPRTPCTLDPTGSKQQNAQTLLLSRSQVTESDVLMANGCKSQGYQYYRKQYSVHRQLGYDEITSSSMAISRVHLTGGRFLTAADATGELWREVAKAELLEDIRKKNKGFETQSLSTSR